MKTNCPYGKNVFLTGGSSGIGLATAELFASNGFTVYAASRNPRLEPAPFPGGGGIRPVALDVRDMRSVGEAARNVLEQADIGIVIHCAGIGIACPAEEYPAEAVEGLLETNLEGVMRVNSRFLPHLRERGGGLCVMIGSVAGVFPIPFQSHYSASKAALDIYAGALRMELRDYNVRVSVIMPGDTDTGFTDARVYAVANTSPYYTDCLRTTQKMEKDERSGGPPNSCARAILKLSARKDPPARKVIGFSYKLLVFLKRLLPDRLAMFILRAMYMGSSKNGKRKEKGLWA